MKSVTGFGLMLVSMLLFLAWLGLCIVNGFIYEREVGGHLKRAADANTLQLAEQELVVAVNYLEKHQLTHGYTSIFFTTPDEDVGFWYTNLSASLSELKKLSTDTTRLEQSNTLIKLRETLLDQQQGDTSVTAPSGISRYPHNTLFFWWGWLSFIFSGLFFLIWIAGRQH
ncbi:MAG: hypothetical protein Q7S52_03250 [bacterium]|nr:hypothetical protein [bacterium]